MPSIIIYAGNDLQRLGELRTAVSIAERGVETARDRAASAAPARAGDDAPDAVRVAQEAVAAAEAACDAFIDEAAERADEWIIEPIGHEAWRDLLKAHPPRMVTKGEGDEAKQVEHEDDEAWGVNTETFGKALLLFVDAEDSEHRTITKAGHAPLADVPKRLKRLPMGQFETLWVAAFQLNVGGITAPKAERYSIATSGSTET